MRRYEAGVFSSLYGTAFGEALWDFLNERETLAMLKTAAALDRPGVEGIEEPLLDRFGRDIGDDRAKQMCGHMVRQIMEAEGYRVSVQNTKIRNGGPFSRGTKYRKRDEVIMHSFRNSADPRLFALAASKGGFGLPRGKGSWSHHQPVKGAARIAMLTMTKAATVIDAVEKAGHFLYRLDRITRPAR